MALFGPRFGPNRNFLNPTLSIGPQRGSVVEMRWGQRILQRCCLFVLLLKVCYQALKKKKTTLLCFLENLPVESLPQQRQICDQGYIRWIFKQNLEAIFADSLVLSWLFCRDCPFVHFLVTVYCSSATVQQLTLWHALSNKNLAIYLRRVIYLATVTFLAFANNTLWLALLSISAK
ncbi:hypothetical protein CFC21_041293 [Triticum aestivum]|uniref:Uncharacterized protein n=2 Tax=Triticum aestivum TaxID=4565 RepID=A0A3B6FL59_WHEAT|nr:hypothetical protein CFC21_041293 [Triticum aestivum]